MKDKKIKPVSEQVLDNIVGNLSKDDLILSIQVVNNAYAPPAEAKATRTYQITLVDESTMLMVAYK